VQRRCAAPTLLRMTIFLTALVDGLGIGSVYALVALGYSFVFRTTGSFNFAQGQLVTFGSLFAYTLYVRAGLPAAVAALAIFVAVGALGGLTERLAIWPLARRGDDTLKWLMSTLGVAVLFTGAAERIWGSQPLGVPQYLSVTVIHLGSITVSSSYALAFAMTMALVIAVDLFQRFTLTGRVMRAVGENRAAVELAGVDVLRLGFISFVISAGFAGLAGFIIAPVTFADATLGFNFVILSFTALTIGGFASHWGAVAGGWLVGITGSMAGTYAGLVYQQIAVFALLLLVLLARPEGLMNRAGLRRV
jgi:branched-chain amino acid transport system permease protein